MNSPWLVALPSGSGLQVNRKTRGVFPYWKGRLTSTVVERREGYDAHFSGRR
jgi:hypothetical protein